MLPYTISLVWVWERGFFGSLQLQRAGVFLALWVLRTFQGGITAYFPQEGAVTCLQIPGSHSLDQYPVLLANDPSIPSSNASFSMLCRSGGQWEPTRSLTGHWLITTIRPTFTCDKGRQRGPHSCLMKAGSQCTAGLQCSGNAKGWASSAIRLTPSLLAFHAKQPFPVLIRKGPGILMDNNGLVCAK